MNTINDQILSGSSKVGSTASSDATKTNKNQFGKEEFLKILITQLKNQDPLNPIEDKEFTSQMTAFSQLEQLININNNITTQQPNGVNSLASYLGKEVVLDSDIVSVEGGNGGFIEFELPTNSTDIKLHLLSSSGSIQEQINLGDMTSGKHRVDLSNLGAANGDYRVIIKGSRVGGGDAVPVVNAGGLVQGFRPSDSSLLLAGREVGIGDIKVVREMNSVAQ